MSNLHLFNQRNNLSIIWDVLLDELNVNKTNKQMITNIRTVFEGNINQFMSRANNQMSLIELNKLFLSQVVLAVNRLFPNIQNIKRITIFDEEITEPYKIEDIHASRQNNLEKELERQKMDLDNYFAPQQQTHIDFSDKITDEKITSMDIEEKIMQRNNEIGDIPITDWTKAKETNIKKKVSWNDNELTQDNILNKLKKIPPTPTQSQEYVEQESKSLTDFSESIRIPISTNQLTTEQTMIPLSEIVKLLNELHKKIDEVQLSINKLTNN
jgi:hypothetical protein